MNDDVIEVIPGFAGGLGNQMFQIAMAHVFARQVGGVVALGDGIWQSLGQGHKAGNYLEGLFSKFRRTQVREDALLVHETQWKPGCRPELRLPRGVRQILIRGFWQLPAMWECEHREIRDLFQFEVERSSSTGVHIRGGDYRFAHHQSREAYHSQLGPLYYEQAMANLSMFPDFYSDDPSFVRCLASGVLPVPGSEEDHFRAMAGCAELVLSKSTFAWWAAFLGAVPFVIMPAAWFWDWEFQPSWAMRIDGWKVFSPNSILWDFHRWHRNSPEKPDLADEIMNISPEEWAPWRSRTEILNDLVCLTGAHSYLETGCGRGANLRAIECERKSAVDAGDDANACDATLFRMTPEEFFEIQDETFDLIFIRCAADTAEFGRNLKRALGSLTGKGVLVCDGLTEDGLWREWRSLQRVETDRVFVGVDCENGMGLAFPVVSEEEWSDGGKQDDGDTDHGEIHPDLLPPDEAKHFVHGLLTTRINNRTSDASSEPQSALT